MEFKQPTGGSILIRKDLALYVRKQKQTAQNETNKHMQLNIDVGLTLFF